MCLQVSCKAAPGDDLPVNLDTLGDSASTVRNYAFASFWVQLPLTIVSACILIFALLYSKGVSPGDRASSLKPTTFSGRQIACCHDSADERTHCVGMTHIIMISGAAYSSTATAVQQRYSSTTMQQYPGITVVCFAIDCISPYPPSSLTLRNSSYCPLLLLLLPAH
jgi:hypothetical protein